VGAGAGSYEPPDITAAPVEPSAVMAAQRPPALVPAVLTIHHWHDLRRGLQELRRVTNGPIVILTADPDVASSWWLPVDYPELDIEIEARVAERLAADLRAGRWDRRHGELRTLSEFDTGLRLVIAHG
jgi:hypothetical protein